YMSPEQVRGLPVDARSDIFSFGVVLYEMLAGRHAFRGESSADTMTAILREEPVALPQLAPEVPAGLNRIVQRCLEKQPAARFRSAADLAYALEAVATSGSSGSHAEGDGPAASPRARFRRLTFRNGHVAIARFTPDGAGVVYGAAWDGRPHEIFTSRTGSPESRSLGLPAGSLLSMSAAGEMAISLGYHNFSWFQVSGTLARVALAGGGVRPLQKNVGHADWSPDGRTMALVRYKGGHCMLEYPAGKVVHETTDWLSYCRVSPDGRNVAFGRNHRTGEGEADVCVIDANGKLITLATDFTNLSGLAWSPSGDEVWFSGINGEQRHGIWGATLDGRVREVHVAATRITLHDTRPDGRALVTMDELRLVLCVGGPSDEREIDMSWFDGSFAGPLSADGSRILFIEVAEAENPHYACYMRGLDFSPAVRLGEGIGTHISADGEWVLAVTHHKRHALMLYPVGFGEAREIPLQGIDRVFWAGFHPDGLHAFVVGAGPGHPRAIHLVPLAGGEAKLLWDEEFDFDRLVGLPITPDGERFVLKRASGEHVLHAWGSSTSEPLPGLTPNEVALTFDVPGKFLYVTANTGHARRIDRIELATGARTPWRTTQPMDPKGVAFVATPFVASGGSHYAYSYLRLITNLHVVEGLDR
ncbi:MAG TPA: protein kinase, partial [Candidatus Acidoferrales bacterium]|nr:protein kinase [Candidatus Acidoferrales bacterium]